MLDDVMINKIAIIQNCLQRISEEYVHHENELESNSTKQDSIILNLQRACEAAIALGMRCIKIKKLAIPQQSHDVFATLEKHHLISEEISKQMQAMVEFRNTAVRDYQKLKKHVKYSPKYAVWSAFSAQFLKKPITLLWRAKMFSSLCAFASFAFFAF